MGLRVNELRIGNYVRTYGQDVGHRTIAGITPEGVNLLEQDEKIDYNLIEPIPLTEEWLEKFGFEIVGDGYAEKWVGDFECCVNYGEGYLFFGQCDDYSHSIFIGYVHSLQNLYFALTGEELNL